jgi:hypothetical protein
MTMYRKLSFVSMMAALVLAAGQARAGGPPMLCLPIDGVTTENAGECARLLADKLENQIFPGNEDFRPIEIRQFGNQWYLTFYFVEDVALSDLESALDGSRFTIPRDRLHFFGHVVLDIDAGATPLDDLKTSLEALAYVAVGSSETEQNRILLTVDMPYPEKDLRRTPEAVRQNSFQWNDLSSNPSARSNEPASAEQLPNDRHFQKTLAKHDAKLRDIRWTTANACRVVGGVAVQEADGKLSKTAQAAVAR